MAEQGPGPIPSTLVRGPASTSDVRSASRSHACRQVLAERAGGSRGPGALRGVGRVCEAARKRVRACVAFPVVVAAVAAVVLGHGLGRLPLWRDEVASVDIAARPVAGILASAGRIDVVHTAYYLLLHPLLALGDGEAWVRLPSLAGAVAAVALTAELARRLTGLGPALVAGALLLGNPWFAFYAREARPYALATALVCAAAFALLGGPPSGPRLAVFTGLGVLATWVHLFDLFPVLGLLTAQSLLAWRRAPGSWAASLRLAMGAQAALVLVASAAPLALIAAAEARQVSWVGEPTAKDVTTLLRDATGSAAVETVVLALLPLAAVTTSLTLIARRVGRGETPDRAAPSGATLVTVLVGALAGPVVLLGVSWAATPLYVERYVLAAAPLLALAAAAAVRLWPEPVRTVAAGLALVVALNGVPAVVGGPADKTEDLRAAAAALAAAARRGDCVAYDPSWARVGLVHYLRAAPVRPRDVAIDPGPAGQEPVGLFPAELPLPAVEADLRACSRIWVAGYPGPVGRWRPVPEVVGPALAAVAAGFTAAAPTDFGDFRLTLWTAR